MHLAVFLCGALAVISSHAAVFTQRVKSQENSTDRQMNAESLCGSHNGVDFSLEAVMGKGWDQTTSDLFAACNLPQTYPPIIMHDEPIPGYSFTPTTAINAKFGSSADMKNMYADGRFVMKNPTIHLGNYVDVTEITCSPESISVHFKSTSMALNAYTHWTPGAFDVIVPDRAKCNGNNEMVMRSVSDVLLSGKGSAPLVVLRTGQRSVHDMIQELDLTIQIPKRRKIQKRSATFPIGINWEAMSKAITKPSLNIMNLDSLVISCEQLCLIGLTQLALAPFGKCSKNATTGSRVRGKVLLMADYKNPISTQLEHTLLSIPLSPISIPGLVSFGPELMLKTAFKVSVGKLQAKSDVQVHLDTPSNQVLVVPMKVSERVPIQVQLNLTPRFQFALSFANTCPMSFGAEWNSCIGLRTHVRDCKPGASRINKVVTYEFFHEHALTMGVLSFDFSRILNFRDSNNIPQSNRVQRSCHMNQLN